MSSYSLRRVLAVAFTGFIFTGVCGATSLKLDETLDLAVPTASGIGYASYQSTGFSDTTTSLKLDVGDTLTYTVKFAHNESLSLQNVQYLWGYVGGTPTTDVVGTGQLELLAADGSVLLTSNLKTDTEGTEHVGQAFLSADFLGGLPEVTTFYGIRYVGTVDSYADGSLSGTYGAPGFEYLADPAPTSTPAIPEPSAAWMMLAGLAALGLGWQTSRQLRL